MSRTRDPLWLRWALQPRSTIPAEVVQERMRITFELYETARLMALARFRRENPGASRQEEERFLHRWATKADQEPPTDIGPVFRSFEEWVEHRRRREREAREGAGDGASAGGEPDGEAP